MLKGLLSKVVGGSNEREIAKLNPLVEAINEKGLGEKVQVIETGCNGFCAMGPILVVHPGDIFYQKLTVEDMPELVESHLIKGKPVARLLYKDPVSNR